MWIVFIERAGFEKEKMLLVCSVFSPENLDLQKRLSLQQRFSRKRFARVGSETV